MFEHELKNAYIGGYYEYSYDFRNKTATNLTNDGWIFSAGQSQFTSDSNGCWRNSTSSETKAIINIGDILTNANKVTLDVDIYINKVTTWDSFLVRICNASYGDVAGVYMGGIMNNGASGYRFNIPSQGLSQAQTYTTGDITFHCVYDLINKTAVMSNTKGYSDISFTLTDADVTNLRADQYTYISIYASSHTPVYKLKGFTITVES